MFEIFFLFRLSEASVFPENIHSLPGDTVYSKTQEHIFKIYCCCTNVLIVKSKINLFICKIMSIVAFQNITSFKSK